MFPQQNKWDKDRRYLLNEGKLEQLPTNEQQKNRGIAENPSCFTGQKLVIIKSAVEEIFLYSPIW